MKHRPRISATLRDKNFDKRRGRDIIKIKMLIMLVYYGKIIIAYLKNLCRVQISNKRGPQISAALE